MNDIKRKAQTGELPLAFCAGALLVCEAAEKQGVVLTEAEVIEVVQVHQILTVIQAGKAVQHAVNFRQVGGEGNVKVKVRAVGATCAGAIQAQ